MTVFLLIVALLFGTVECKASCVADECEKAPPCHGQKTVRVCSNELVVDRPAAAVVSSVVAPLRDVSVETVSSAWRPHVLFRHASPSPPPLRI